MPIDLVAKPLNSRVVEAIRLEMTRQRVSQHGLAKALGHSQAYVSWRLLGRTGLKLSEVEDIAQALGISVDHLLTAPDPLALKRRRASLWVS